MTGVYDGRSLEDRKTAVRQQLSIGDVIGLHWKLAGSGRSTKRRAKCGFHGSNSLSFSIKDADTGAGSARCWGCGCGWHGDMFQFLMDLKGWPFMDALAELERLAGLSNQGGEDRAARGIVQRQKAAQPKVRRHREPVSGLEMGRWIWKHAMRDDRAVRRYFMGRGVPEALLTADRLKDFRFLADCPCYAWLEGEVPSPDRLGNMLRAAAVVGLVRVPTMMGDPPALEWVPVGVHVTYLDPDGTGTMRRLSPFARPGDDDPWLPKRRMLGPVGKGCIVLGDYRREARLWVGEGNETVLSGMALGAAGPADVGVATLSLDNLQGAVRKWRNNVWPLFDIRPDPEGRRCFLVPGHRGAAVGLVDADMKPLRGMKHPKTGAYQGEAVVERKGGGIIRRAITGAERAQICGELFVKGWRAAGCDARAVRAPAGMDFNDAIQEG